MIEINGKVYRNLQEQVEKNKDDIARLRKGIASEFTAGEGIVIDEELVISVDMDDIKSNLADVASTGSYTDLINTPDFATVATSGLYSDLSNTPTFSTGLTVTTATSGPIITIDNDEIDDRVQYDIENNITTDSNDNILSLYGYGVTNVIANPTGTAGTPLSKIQINSTKYYIPYTSVEVNNPVQTGDLPLNSIEVDGDNYYIPQPTPKVVKCEKKPATPPVTTAIHFALPLFTSANISSSTTWSDIFDLIPVGYTSVSGVNYVDSTIYPITALYKQSISSDSITIYYGGLNLFIKTIYKTDDVTVSI